MNQRPVRNHLVEVSRDERRHVVLKVIAAKFLKNRTWRDVQRPIKLGNALLSDNPLNGGLHRICERASQISTKFIQGFLGTMKGFLRQVCAIPILVPSRDRAHKQSAVSSEEQRTKIGNYAGRLRSTFSFISDSVVISGCRVYT